MTYQLCSINYQLTSGIFMKIAICNELFEGWDIAKVFDYAAQLGYDGVELAPFTLGETASDISQAERKRIREAAANADISSLISSSPMKALKSPDFTGCW